MQFVPYEPDQNYSDRESSSDTPATTRTPRKTLTDTERKARRAQKAKEKRAREKAEKEAADEDDDSEGPTRKRKARAQKGKDKKKKKQKKSVQDEEDTEEEAEEEILEVAVYIEIESLKPTAAPRKGAKAPAVSIIRRGPSMLPVNASFDDFQTAIAAKTPCNVNMLAVKHFTWKWDQPANSKRKPVTDQDGFCALVASAKVKAKRGAAALTLYMPPPAKDVVSGLSSYYAL